MFYPVFFQTHLLLWTDNNYQSPQSYSNKKHEIEYYWLKIGKIGNYCQLKVACYLISIPLKIIDISITSPSHLHRYSIETMDLRWSNDGVTMEYLRRKNEGRTEEERRKNGGRAKERQGGNKVKKVIKWGWKNKGKRRKKYFSCSLFWMFKIFLLILWANCVNLINAIII